MVEAGQTRVGTNNFMAGASSGDINALVLPQLRTFAGYHTWLAVRVATGEVLNGLLSANPNWLAYPSAPSATATIYRVRESKNGPIPQVGYLISPHDRRAKFYGGQTFSPGTPVIGETLAMSVGSGYLSAGPFSAFERTVSFREVEGLEPSPGFYRGDTAYISSAASYRWLWRVLRLDGSVDTWFDNRGDESSAVLGLATDGKDLVWHRTEGCKRATPCTSATLYTSAHPAPGVQPVPRRLRTEYPYVFKLVVGCGYVAATGGFADYRSMLRVTRLRDGVSFLRQKTETSAYNYQQPIAVSCDHVYFTRVDQIEPDQPPRTNLVRIRLDALGPEIAPD